MQLIELVASYFKEFVQKFPGQMSTDNVSLAHDIKKWNSEFSIRNITPEELIEIKDAIDQDPRFVPKPPTLADFFAIKLLLDKIKALGDDQNTKRIIDEVKVTNRKFSQRYNKRWRLESLEDEVERTIAWVSDLLLYNVTVESMPKAVDWFGTKSDWNRFAPTLPEFITACRMAALGEDVPSWREAHMIILGVSKRKTHPLVEWVRLSVKQFESKFNKAIPAEIFATIYNDALMEFSAQGKIPDLPVAQSGQKIDNSGIIEKAEMLDLIKKIRRELGNE